MVIGLITGSWSGLFMKTVTTWIRMWCYIRPCMMIYGLPCWWAWLTSMSLWISGCKRCNRENCTHGERLVTTNGYLRIMWASKWILELGFEILCFPICYKARCNWFDVDDNRLECNGKILRRGASMFVWLVHVLYFKFRGRNFFKEGRMWSPVLLEG